MLSVLRDLADLPRRYPLRFVVGLGLASAVATGGAWAVSALGPDVADVPVQQIVQPVALDDLARQSDLLSTQPLSLYRSEVTRSSDTADTLLRRLDVDDPQAAAFLRRDPQAKQVILGRAGRNVRAEIDADHRLIRLQAYWTSGGEGQFHRMVVEKVDTHWVAHEEKAALQMSTRLASGVVRGSLYATTDEARIPDSVTTQLTDIFASDIDFHRNLHNGDRFAVVFETQEADGEPLRYGRVLSAEFVSSGKTYQALWFQEPGQSGGYYTPSGQSLRRNYLAAPVPFSRITSGFKMRFNPVLQKWRAHNGVDYGAPLGTPVHTVGDGVVKFAGAQNGYGNVVFVQHRGVESTVYAHLSKILVKPGQKVSQGDTIGLVGATGWATAPHLHFEFRINGVYRDPSTVAHLAESHPVSTAARPRFNQLAAQYHAELLAAAQFQTNPAQ